MHSTASENLSGPRFMLRALRHRNYRLFFGGQLVSLVGTWISTVASSWLVYRLAVDADQPAAFLLGLVAFVGQIPVFLLAPLAGVWVDRWNRHTILVATQTLSMLQSFTLAALALSDRIDIPQLMVLNALQGMINAIDIPARQSFTVEMVEDPADLSNAIALSSSLVHSARLFGPALAGYLIYVASEGVCFLIDGFSYLGVLVALLAMRLPRRARAEHALRPLAALREGWRYAFGFRPIRALIVMVAVTSLVTAGQTTLMPIVAEQRVGGGARTLGLLLGSAGLGALAGSLYLASRRSVLGLGRVIAAACASLGMALVLFALVRSLALAIPLLVLLGFSLVVQMASCNTLLQTIVDNDKRGRVMALYTMAFLGVLPLGSLLAGSVATLVGVPGTLAASGAICLIVAGVFASRLAALRPLVEPIYQSKGILPPVADGLADTEIIASANLE